MDLFSLEAVINLTTKGFTDGLNLAKNAMQQFVGVTAGFFKDVFDNGLEFERAMAGVYAVTNTTDESTQKLLADAALVEAQTSKFTSVETAMAEYYMGLAGFELDDIRAGLHGIVVTAEAAGESLDRVSDIITDGITSFHMGTDETERFGNALAATATNSNTTITQMGEALKYVGPLAGSLGYDIEDLSTSIGTLANSSIKGSMAGTSLRNIITRLSTNAGATQTKLGALDLVTKKLGVSFYESGGNVRDWGDFIKDARDAWQGLNAEDKDSILNAMVETSGTIENADEFMQAFSHDIEAAGKNLDNFKAKGTSDAGMKQAEENIRQIAASYSELFKMLDMDVDPAKDDVAALTNALTNARTRLGEMTDAEKVEIANRVGNTRAMTAWLTLMDAEGEKYDDLDEKIHNATGAAEEMKEIRMGSNLAGDVDKANAALEVLGQRIYQDVNGPAREVVQWGTGAITEISDAIGKNGLEGGIEVLGQKVEEAGEKFKPMFESLGKAAAPIVVALINTVKDDIIPVALEIGSSFGQGFLDGLVGTGETGPVTTGLAGIISNFLGGLNSSSELTGKSGKDSRRIASGLLGGVINAITGGVDGGLSFLVKPELDTKEFDGDFNQFTSDIEGEKSATENNPWVIPLSTVTDSTLADEKTAAESDPWQVPVELPSPEEVEGLVAPAREAVESNPLNITFNPPEDGMEAIKSGILEACNEGGTEAASTIGAAITAASDIQDAVSTDIGDAGSTGGADMVGNIEGAVSGTTIGKTLSTDIGNAGITGGKASATNLGNEMKRGSTSIANDLSSKLGNKGQPIGRTLASGIKSVLSSTPFKINVSANVTGLPGGATVHKNASAMSSGRIFKKPTVFGYTDNAWQVAGDAGPEAVVGVTSLRGMIQDAVRGAQQVVVPRNSAPQDITIVVKLADDTELGRAVYRMYNDEKRRAGSALAAGVT